MLVESVIRLRNYLFITLQKRCGCQEGGGASPSVPPADACAPSAESADGALTRRHVARTRLSSALRPPPEAIPVPEACTHLMVAAAEQSFPEPVLAVLCGPPHFL